MMGDKVFITRALARFAEATQWGDVPPAVRHEAKRALVNYFAVALAGARDPMMDKACSVYGRFSAGEQAFIIGRSARMDMRNAAALNAMSANLYDFDDTHIPTIIHPSAPVAAALFAFAQTRSMTGEDFLLAFVLGVDAACRIGNAVSPEHYRRGWHITSTCCVFGAAVAIAKVLGLDAEKIAHAIGHASGQAGGLVETLGTMSKSVSVGNAASNGILAALLAREGLAGPLLPLEGARGFLKVTCVSPDMNAITQDLGQKWELLSNTYKPYPCGVVLNPVIDACLDLHHAGGWSMDNVDHVELTGHPLLRERTDRPDVRSGRESQVSAQHAVAVALAKGRAGLAQFSDQAVMEPALRAFGAKLRFIDDASLSIDSARVALVLKSGEKVSRHVPMARGSLGLPLTDGELEEKLRRLAAESGTGVDPQALADAVWKLDTAADAAIPMRFARS